MPATVTGVAKRKKSKLSLPFRGIQYLNSLREGVVVVGGGVVRDNTPHRDGFNSTQSSLYTFPSVLTFHVSLTSNN